MTAQSNPSSTSDINIPTAQQDVEETLPNLTNRVLELEPESGYAPPLAAITFSDSDNDEFKNFKNSQQLFDCNTNIIEFLNSIYLTFGIDLTSKDITTLNDVVNTIEGSWTFFTLLVKHQVQMVCQGFRKSTTESTQGKKGPTGTTLPDYMGTVRPVSNRGGQQSAITTVYQALQATNTLMSVIGRQVPIDARGNVGVYNNGYVITSSDYELVNKHLNKIGNWDLTQLESNQEGITVKQILERVHLDVNTFLNNRNPRIFNCNTASFFPTKGNAEWLSNPHRNQKNAGSYYWIGDNSYTTTGLSTTNTMNARKSLTGITNGSNNTLVLTAQSPIFSDFWITETDGKGKSVITVNPEELFEKCFDGNYNRSVTLPSGGYLLSYNGNTTFVNQNMIDLLSGELHQPELDGNTSTPINVIQGKTITGNTLLGALTLGLMRLGGYPVENYVSPTFLNEVITQYKLTSIISTFSDIKEGTLPASVIEASAKVERSEVPLRAAWLANMIMGIIGSSTQGAANAVNRASQTIESAMDDVSEDDAFNLPSALLKEEDMPTSSSSISS